MGCRVLVFPFAFLSAAASTGLTGHIKFESHFAPLQLSSPEACSSLKHLEFNDGYSGCVKILYLAQIVNVIAMPFWNRARQLGTRLSAHLSIIQTSARYASSRSS